MKKVLVCFISILLVISCSVPAFAAPRYLFDEADTLS